jgi:hypothetical protein
MPEHQCRIGRCVNEPAAASVSVHPNEPLGGHQQPHGRFYEEEEFMNNLNPTKRHDTRTVRNVRAVPSSTSDLPA